MKTRLAGLSREYAAALRKYLKRGPRASLQPARGLGRKAMALGLETLDLARIHEQALISLNRSHDREELLKRVERFFAEAIAPIETAQHGSQEAKVRLNRLNGTVDLAASNRCLKQGIVQRKAAEKALKKSGEHFTRLLKESHQLQKHLRHQTHQIMLAQEDERRKLSRELHDEVAQTLLGINVRLLTLKNGSTVDAEGLRAEITTTQRLVEESVQSINRLAHDLDIHQQA
jgi:signal transduction histidine kinase